MLKQKGKLVVLLDNRGSKVTSYNWPALADLPSGTTDVIYQKISLRFGGSKSVGHLDYSDDGSTWTAYWTSPEPMGGTKVIELYNFEYHKYWRVVFTTWHGDGGYSEPTLQAYALDTNI